MDPLAENYVTLTPYNYVGNRPITFTDPDGRSMNAFTTRYVDPRGNTLLNTDDGRDDVFVVPYSRIGEFQRDAYWAQKTGASNSIGWNDYWRGEFTQIVSGSFLNQLHSEAAKQAFIDFMISGGYSGGNYDEWMWFLLCELGGQWTDPELVAMGMSIGINGLHYLSTLKSLSRIQAGSLKELKVLVNRLSKPGSKLTQQELNELKTLVQKYKGTIREDLSGVNGTGVDPHAHVEGLGKKIESRHIWL